MTRSHRYLKASDKTMIINTTITVSVADSFSAPRIEEIHLSTTAWNKYSGRLRLPQNEVNLLNGML